MTEHQRLARAETGIAAWENRVRPAIVAAAIAPLLLALMPWDVGSGVVLAVDLVSWGVFVIDLIVHIRYDRHYLRSGVGKFDLGIVLLTFPWYALPGVDGTQFLAVFRLARLARLFTVTSGGRVRYIFDKLGGLLLATAIVLLVASLMVLDAEPPESGFENFGDALWWAVVTLTTVGYGDFFPVSPQGRFAGVILMLMGLAVLGTLAGVLAAVLGGAAEEESAGEDDAVPGPELPFDLDARLANLETQVASIKSILEGADQPPDDTSGRSGSSR